ncbi:MAG: hypothetical protein ACTSWW_06150 [Promethearchaeota archaeon]
MSKKKIPPSFRRAQDLIEEGHFAEGLEFLRSLEPIDDYTGSQKTIFYTLSSEIHFFLGDYPKAFETGEKGMQFANNIEMNLEVVDAFINMANLLKYKGKNRESMKLLEESAEILHNLSTISEKDQKQRLGFIYLQKGVAYSHRGDSENAIKNLEESINLLGKWGSQAHLAQAYSSYGNMSRIVGDYSKADSLLTKSRKICEDKESTQYNLPKLLNMYGSSVIAANTGEVQLSLEYGKKGVALARKYKNPSFTQMGLNNLGCIYRDLGEWDLAIETLNDALPLTEKIGHSLSIIFILDTLFEVYIRKEDIAAAQQIFQKIEQYREKEKENKYHDLLYQYCKAILLKTSQRTRDLGMAQEILESIAKQEVIHIGVTQKAILNLCEMLLNEFEGTKNIEASKEFSFLLKRLQNTAEKHHSYPMLAETYVLDAKLNMLHFDLKKARHSLTQAQKIAERYGLTRLAIKISNEHDKLLQNLEVWNQMKESNASISDRLEKIAINDQISTMLKTKRGEIPDASPESPILLIIMASSGLPLYTKIFSKEWTFSEGLFSGFLSAFNSFSDQIFSEGLDRANFGKYTILMANLAPFMICYVFEGQSFLAQQKFSQFNSTVHDSEQIWKKLTLANRTGQIIRDDSGEGLGLIVTTIF